MSAFQPILTCFLCLVFANIAVKGMAIVTSRRFMCSGEAISSKSYMTNLLDEWRKQKKESTRLNINQSQINVNRTKLDSTIHYLWNESNANSQCANDANCLDSTMYKLRFWSECLQLSLYSRDVSKNLCCRMPSSENSCCNLEKTTLQTFLRKLDHIIFVDPSITMQVSSAECQGNGIRPEIGLEDVCTVFDQRFSYHGQRFINSSCENSG